MKYQRPDGFEKERRDCTVIAISVAAGVRYEVAHATLKAAGRKDHKGFNMRGFMRGKELLFGQRVYPATFKRKQLVNFVSDHPVGRFLVRKSGHCLAVMDGEIINPISHTPPLARVTHVWEFQSTTINP